MIYRIINILIYCIEKYNWQSLAGLLSIAFQLSQVDEYYLNFQKK